VNDIHRPFKEFVVGVLALLACTSVHAARLDYFSGRKWVEQQCRTNTTPQDDRIFIGRMDSPRYASIVRFKKGITLRELIDQTPFKGKEVLVCVMRPDRLKTGPFTRHAYIKIGPSDGPDYEVKGLDVIWLHDDGPIIDR
jgi:hypothetical protein